MLQYAKIVKVTSHYKVVIIYNILDERILSPI